MLTVHASKKIYHALHNCLDQAVINGYLPRNPLQGVKLPQVTKKEMIILTQEEQNALHMAAQESHTAAAFGIVFTLSTGIRMGEMLGLQWGDLDYNNHSVRNDFMIYYKKQQKLLQAQGIPLIPTTPIFSAPLGLVYEPRTYEDLFKRTLYEADVPDINFHALRHTFATKALEAGMDIKVLSSILGHAQASTTVNIENPYEQLKESKQLDYVCDSGREKSLPPFIFLLRFCEFVFVFSQLSAIIIQKKAKTAKGYPFIGYFVTYEHPFVC